MARLTPGGLSRGRLRLVLGGFFLALGIPTTVLVIHAYDQLKWEAFHQTRELARNLAQRIDEHLQQLVREEDDRDFSQYQFLVVRGSDASNFVQPSSLSRFPVSSDIPGLVGYFQVDATGRFTTPLLPVNPTLAGSYGIDARERRLRADQEDAVLAVLDRYVLGGSRSHPRARTEAASDEVDAASAPGKETRALELDLGKNISRLKKLDEDRFAGGRKDEGSSNARKLKASAAKGSGSLEISALPRAAAQVEDLELESPYPGAPLSDAATSSDSGARQKLAPRKSRRKLEQSAELPSTAIGLADAPSPGRDRHITTFESELDPFELSRLDRAHLVLHRTAWRDGQRYTQGALIDHDRFMDGIVGESFRGAALARLGTVTVAWAGVVSAVFSSEPDRGRPSLTRSLPGPGPGTLLYRTRLSAPASRMELLFSVTRMQAGPGARILAWATAVMALVLAGGLLLMYRLGLREIDLARQQQDFVAAVSHELRTPLTSIRMYGEMLREGWASEDKKRSYYDFIYNESERLSRLISNVLQLARMTRNQTEVELSPATVSELMDGVRSKVAAQAESSGFELVFSVPVELASDSVQVNTDAFSQIMINLVDNAIKFSLRSDIRRVEIAVQPSGDDRRLLFSVRDHGPGVERDQMKKIFRLFYRSEDELTRETVGTGIGLALVNRLARAMHAEVDVTNAGPGARFTLSIPRSRVHG